MLQRLPIKRKKLSNQELRRRPGRRTIFSLIPVHHREPVDMREVAVRLFDAGELLQFKPGYGMVTVCAQSRINGHAMRIA